MTETTTHTAGLGRGHRQLKRSSPFAHAFQYYALRILVEVLSWLSWSATRRVGRNLGDLTARVIRLRWNVTLDNLAHAFPERQPKELEQLAREAYRQVGVTFLELFRRLGPGEARARVHHFDPMVLERVRAEGRGVVLVTGHLANWELIGSALAGFGFPLTVVVATQRNRRVDALVTRMREVSGLRVLRTDGGLRPMLRVLKRNEFLCFLNDQDAGPRGHFVPFLGRLASTALGPARFARLAGCAIVPGFSIRQPDGTYHLDLTDVIRLRDDLDPDAAEREATEQMVGLLEARIRRYPEQWFWMHRRWKTRPPGEHLSLRL